MNLARAGNKYLTDTEPWKVFKTDPERVERILHLCLQLIANLSVLGEPFIPFSSAKLKAMLALNEDLRWKDAGRMDIVTSGSSIGKAVHLFNKIEDKEIEQQINKLKSKGEASNKPQNAGQKQNTMDTAEAKAEITFDDFMKLDLKVGTIIAAEKMPKADKLLVLSVDMGNEKRTIVSGIAEHYSSEEIINKQVVVLTNLAPRKLRGVLSEGMVLMAEDSEGKLSFVSPETAIAAGSNVR